MLDHWRTRLEEPIHGPLRHKAKPTGGRMDLSKGKAQSEPRLRRRKARKSLVGSPFGYAEALESLK